MEYRVRSKVSKEELDSKIGKILTPKDYNILLTGATKVMLPNGEPLCVYLPSSISQESLDNSYDILHKIRATTSARGYASGSQSFVTKTGQHRYKPIMSSIIGNVEPMGGGRFPFCRTTAWTGKYTQEFKQLYPLFGEIADLFKQHVPHRYNNQWQKTLQTEADWRIGNTPYTTMTVNNTYPTGVHTDKGDLEEGFSCLMGMRRGNYTGGQLVFPEYRIAVDMKEGDLILMDAHQWHGNVAIERLSDDAERISLVLYYRTNMMFCGTMEEEAEKENYVRSRPLLNKNKQDERTE